MAKLSTRPLMKRLFQVRRLAGDGRRPSPPAGRKRQARLLAVEQLEDRCLLSSTLQAISLPPPGQPPSDTAAGASVLPAVSADGRYVAFESTAVNLVPGETTPTVFAVAGPNVFLLDRTTGSVTLVSHLPGAPTTESLSNGLPGGPLLLSRDGRYVAYVANLDVTGEVPGLGASPENVVVYDRTTGLNTQVSPTNDSSTAAFVLHTLDAISGNGRYIVFDTGLVSNETGLVADNLYLYDQQTHQTFLITHAAGQDNVPEDYSGYPGSRALSVADNGTVVFSGVDTGGNLVSGQMVYDQAGVSLFNVYLYNPANQTNQLLSAVYGSPAQQADGDSIAPVISEDGSTVVFVSGADDLVANQQGQDGLAVQNVFRYSVASQTMTLVSAAGGSATTGGDADSGILSFLTAAVAVTPDGRYIAFVSQASDLVPGQAGAAGNVFLYDSQTESLTLLSGVEGSSTLGAGGDATVQPPGSQGPYDPVSGNLVQQVLSLSDDGNLVAFVSQANDLVPGQTGAAGNDNLYLYSRASRHASLVTGVEGSATATDAAQSGFPVLSGDGSLLAFHSLAADLGGGFFDGNGVADVFTYSPGGGDLALVSRAAFPQLAPGNSYSTSVSGDGRYTVFTSTANDLVPNQVTVNSNENVFLYDKQTGTVTLVNHPPALPDTTGDGGIDTFPLGQRPDPTQLPVISTVAFTTTDDNLVNGEQKEAFPNPVIYLHNVATGTIKLVNQFPSFPGATVPQREPAISADGRYVAYVLGAQVAQLIEGHPRSVSFKATKQAILAGWQQATRLQGADYVRVEKAMLKRLCKQRVGNRPGRCEPRAVKRRPKAHKLLTGPREQARAKLLKEKVPRG